MFDFDQPINRYASGSIKWQKYAGRDILPMWVADMDFADPPAVIGALQRHLQNQIGRRLVVLTERGGVARAEDFTPVKTPDAEAGRLIEVEISGVEDEALVSTLARGDVDGR